MQYILDGHTPIACSDSLAWAEWFEAADRHVAQETVKGILVSTVFLGLDHGFGSNSQPILFETMTFNETGEVLSIQERYATWDEAEAGHGAIVEELRRSLPV